MKLPRQRPVITVEQKPHALVSGVRVTDGMDVFECEGRERRGGMMEWVKLRNIAVHDPGDGVWFRLVDVYPLAYKGVAREGAT